MPRVFASLAVLIALATGAIAQELGEVDPKPALDAYAKAGKLADDGKKDAAEAAAIDALALSISVDERLIVAGSLQEKGRHQWAEREFRIVLDTFDSETLQTLRVRTMLSEMLHDQQQDLRAAEVLEPLLKFAREEPAAARQLMQRLARAANAVETRSHYFHSLHLKRKGDKAGQRKHLEKANAADPHDVDTLIAMHQLAGDGGWKEKTRAAVVKTEDHLKQQLARLRGRDDQDLRPAFRDFLRHEIASACNQIAWLQANTGRDLDGALKLSRESVGVRPDSAGYLDTLAHCLFARGDFAAAIATQKKALKLDPHSGALRRALKRFEQAAQE